MKPTPGSGSKQQIKHRGQTSSTHHGGNPHVKVKGGKDPAPYGISTKSDG